MTPRHLLAGSLAFSLAFQVAWALSVTPVATSRVEAFAYVLSVLAAVACTLIVPAGLHVWPMIHVPSVWLRWVRNLVMTGVCGAAAMTTFLHSVDVLILMQWSPVAAGAVIGGVELLVVLSTMALRTARPAVADQSAVPVPPVSVLSVPPADTAAVTPVPPEPAATVPSAEPVADDRTDTPVRLSAQYAGRLDDLRTWVADSGEVPSESAVRKRYGCRQSVAQRLLAELAADPAVVAS